MCAKKSTKNSLVDFIFIYLVLLNLGGFNVVKFGDAIDVRGIISLVTSRLAVGTRHYRNLYAMRLHHPGSGESYWLHQDTTMYQVQSGSIPAHYIPASIYLISLLNFLHTFNPRCKRNTSESIRTANGGMNFECVIFLRI